KAPIVRREMHAAATDAPAIQHPPPGISPHRLRVGRAKTLKWLEARVEHRAFALDGQLVVSELVRLLPWTLLEDDDIESGSRQLLRQHAARRPRPDDHEVDGLIVLVDALVHAAGCADSGAVCASYQPNGALYIS